MKLELHAHEEARSHQRKAATQDYRRERKLVLEGLTCLDLEIEQVVWDTPTGKPKHRLVGLASTDLSTVIECLYLNAFGDEFLPEAGPSCG